MMENSIKYTSLDLTNAKYLVLDYIESSGTQYIDTEYIPLANDVFEVKTKLISNSLSDWQAIFGARKSDYLSKSYCLFTRFAGKNQFTYCRTGAETTLSNGIYDSVITITTSGQNITWTNGTNTYSGTTTGTINDCATSLSIFAQAGASFTCAQLYSFVVKRNSKVIHEYIPAVQLISGMIFGLYDKVNDTFYANAGTGEFIAGKVKKIIY